MKNLRGRVVVVTGGAGGIGTALAAEFARSQMRVVLADLDTDRLEAAAARIRVAGAEVLCVATDVSCPDSVDGMRDLVLDRFGSAHVLCNNAGITRTGTSWTVPLQDWHDIVGVNLMGVVHGLRSFMPTLLAQDEAHVLNTASMAGVTSSAGLGPYAVTKHGVVALSEALYRELRVSGSRVGVSVLCPGFVETAMPGSVEQGARVDDQDPVEASIAASVARSSAHPMSPEQLAVIARNAILADKFWVFTHPERAPAVSRRAEQIVQGLPPDSASA